MTQEPRPLAELVDELIDATVPDATLIDPAGVAPDVGVTDVTHDSRQIAPGAVFCCVRGATTDGTRFAADAVAAGAVALLVEEPVDLPVPQIVVPSVRTAMAHLAAELWGHPERSLATVGVTGTNGKTTVVTLIGEILSAAGRSARVIGTLTGARTTPESTDLARQLAEAVADGVEVVAMEVSSHALALDRVAAVRFDVAAFTNLGADHLDFHGTQERYFEAKSRLFRPERSRVAVLNTEDVHGRLLRDTLTADDDPVVVEVAASAVAPVLDHRGSRFTWRGHEVDLPLAGRFNVTNALVAAECVVALGVPAADVAAALASVVAPPGRFELVDEGQPFAVVVDYAHTPDAIDGVLETAREVTTGELVVVLGAGGDRDRSKRGPMGAAACRGADVVIITSDNPRSEDPSTIMSAVADGCAGATPILEIDRRSAIRTALTGRRPGDTVVIAGKGHETTQTIGDQVLPFDDRQVAREELRALGWSS